MSHEALEWVWEHSPFAGATFTVHLAIGRAVKRDLELADPVPELAQRARCGIRAAMTALSELTRGGYLEQIEPGGGRGKPARYRFLTPETPRSDARKPRDINTVFCDKPRGERGVSARAPAILALDLEEITNKHSRANGKGHPDFASEFDAWWPGYPKRVGRAKALEQFTRRRREGVTLETLTTARDAYGREVEGREDRFVLHGATFLGKAGRWSDDWNEQPPERDDEWMVDP